jgi:hypothetical protein
MSTKTILLRHTISKVTSAFEESYAKRLLADPHYSKILEVVETDKPEVLSQATIGGVIVDDNGEPLKGIRNQAKAPKANDEIEKD